MENGGTGVQLQHGLGKQAHNVVAFDETSLFVKMKAAVKIAIPGDAHIRLVRDDCLGGGCAPVGQKGIGHTVGEMSIRLVLNADKGKGQMGLQKIKHWSGAAVAAVHHQLEGLHLFWSGNGKDGADIGILVRPGGIGPL